MIIPLDLGARTVQEILEVPERPCHVRASILVAHLSWIRSQIAQREVDILWSALPQPLRDRRPDSILPTEWISFASLILFDRTAIRLFWPGREQAVYEFGRASAQLNFGGVLGLQRGINIHSHFWDAKAHHERFQDHGACVYTPLNQHSFRLDYSRSFVCSRMLCASALGYLEGSIALLGGHDPIVEETACQCVGDRTCSFVVSWES
ncbi:MAG: 4-vinyl reductase [Thermoanaerobaculia bacterium]